MVYRWSDGGCGCCESVMEVEVLETIEFVPDQFVYLIKTPYDKEPFWTMKAYWVNEPPEL